MKGNCNWVFSSFATADCILHQSAYTVYVKEGGCKFNEIGKITYSSHIFACRESAQGTTLDPLKKDTVNTEEKARSSLPLGGQNLFNSLPL